MHENVGFRDNKGQKVHPNFATNIAMEFRYHTFCAPDETVILGQPLSVLKCGIPKVLASAFGLRLGVQKSSASLLRYEKWHASFALLFPLRTVR